MLRPMRFVSVIIALVAFIMPPVAVASTGDPGVCTASSKMLHCARDDDAIQTRKMWGTIFQKGAPHLAKNRTTEPFSHEARGCAASGNRSAGKRFTGLFSDLPHRLSGGTIYKDEGSDGKTTAYLSAGDFGAWLEKKISPAISSMFR